MQNISGFLLSYIKYGDQDAVLHAYTKDFGYQSFFIKGIYAAKNKKKAYLFPLNELIFTVKPLKDGTLPLVTKIELHSHPSTHNNVKLATVLMLISDFLNQNLRNEEKNDAVFAEIQLFLSELNNENYSAHLIFLVRCLRHFGFAPTEEKGNFLDPEKGIFNENQRHPKFSNLVSNFWQRIINEENPYTIKVPNSSKGEVLDSIFIYYQYHFPDFRVPVSLEIVQQIFNS